MVTITLRYCGYFVLITMHVRRESLQLVTNWIVRIFCLISRIVALSDEYCTYHWNNFFFSRPWTCAKNHISKLLIRHVSPKNFDKKCKCFFFMKFFKTWRKLFDILWEISILSHNSLGDQPGMYRIRKRCNLKN